MGDVTSPAGKRPTPKWGWAASLVLVAASVVGIVWATHRPSVGPSLKSPFGHTSIAPPVTTTTVSPGHHAHPPVTTTTAPTPPPTSSTTTAAGPPPAPPRLRHVVTVPWVSRSRPVYLRIPAIGVSTPLVELGLSAGHVVQVPTSFHVAGWYKFGPTPGQESTAVILGHVDSYQGPGVFYQLDHLQYGDQVLVRNARGQVLHFAVIGMREYRKANFPDRVVYGPRHYAALNLVTCGGVFDRATGHYLSNIVVFTALVKS